MKHPKKRDDERNRLIDEIRNLLRHFVPIRISSAYRRCGNPKCRRCRKEDGRHGPFLGAVYRLNEKTKGFYIPVDAKQDAEKAVGAWRDLRDRIERLGALNREALQQQMRKGSDRS